MAEMGSRDEPSFLHQLVKRRTVLKGIGAGTAIALLPHDHLFGKTSPVVPPITIRPSPLVVDVVRPDAFLRLTFRFVNLGLDPPNPASPKLFRKDTTTDAAIVVDFGPQHVAEQVLWNPGVKDAIPSSAAGIESRLAG